MRFSYLLRLLSAPLQVAAGCPGKADEGLYRRYAGIYGRYTPPTGTISNIEDSGIVVLEVAEYLGKIQKKALRFPYQVANNNLHIMGSTYNGLYI